MKTRLFKPRHKKLQNYIESFYILTNPQTDQANSYLTFPTLFCVVTTVLSARNTISPDKIITRSSSSKQLETSLVCRFNKPICFEYIGEIKEVCIYFKPLGLNAFLENPLDHYSTKHFDEFVPFPDYEASMQEILATENAADLISNVEQYWLGKFIGFEHPFLAEAIDQIERNPKISTQELAQKHNVSQKTLIKHFKTHLCKTPSEYKKILRFRKALAEKQVLNSSSSLIELAHSASFFDQSHMISNFKSLTGLTPGQFFKDLSRLENNRISWIFNPR